MNTSGIWSVMGMLIAFLVVGTIGVLVGGEIIRVTNVTDSWAGESSTSIVETFELGITLCKIIVIISIASIVFKHLWSTGIIPKFDEEDQGGM